MKPRIRFGWWYDCILTGCAFGGWFCYVNEPPCVETEPVKRICWGVTPAMAYRQWESKGRP